MPFLDAIYHLEVADILTIDGAGRLVVPKRLRVELGLHKGRQLEIHREGDRLVLEPVPEQAVLEEVDGLLVVRGGLQGEVPDHRAVRDARFAALGAWEE